MSFYETFKRYGEIDCEEVCASFSAADVERAIRSADPSEYEFMALLSGKTDAHLEEMAQAAHSSSLRNFGKTMLLYTPMYLSNYCVNGCAYCGFNVKNKIGRKKLSLSEVEEEARFISETGLRHILILTGESRAQTPPEYIKDCIGVLKRYFSSISIEIYPLTEEEYADMIAAGVDGLTIYQEVYDENKYRAVHLSGPKTDYKFRLDAPERGCRARMRNVSIGALLGLGDWRKEIFLTALHAQYLQDNYPHTEVGISFPRMRPHEGAFDDVSEVDDRDLVKAILAVRLFLPRVGITISTRESEQLRDNLVPLGVTRMSAGSTTAVGGHTLRVDEDFQFDISDKRSVQEMRAMLMTKGYQAVLKDWWY